MSTEIETKSVEVRTPKKKKRVAQRLNGAARFRKPWVPWLWVGLPIAAMLLFYIYPFINTIVTSFTHTRPLGSMGPFNGVKNYQYIFGDDVFWQAVGNSLIYALVVVPLMVFLPLLLALLVRTNVPGIGFFRAMFYIPAVCSLVVISIAWRFLLDQQGPINNFLRGIGLLENSIPFLSNRWLILFCAMLITLWQGLPYYMILYLSALVNIDDSLYEAAELDGAGPVRRFFTVTVPGVRIMMYLVGVLCLIGSLKIFTEVYLLGGDNSPTKTITMYIRDQIQDPTFGSLGRGTAASVFLFLITFGFILLSQRIQSKAENE